VPAEEGSPPAREFFMERWMASETIGAVISRVATIESDIGGLRRTIDGEQLSVSDRQYVARCFDLLQMELEALREYLSGIPSS
jgi:hypothetical protein